MSLRHGVPKNLPLALHPVNNHLSPRLPSLSFQSLTTIKSSNSLVLKTIRNAWGCTYPLRPRPSRKTLTPSHSGALPPHLPWCSVSASGAYGDAPSLSRPHLTENSRLSTSTAIFVPRIGRRPARGFWSLLLDGSRISDNRSPFCISFINTCETPSQLLILKNLGVELSPLEATLTSRPQLTEKTATLSPLDATLTRFCPLSPLEATLTKKLGGMVPRL